MLASWDHPPQYGYIWNHEALGSLALLQLSKVHAQDFGVW